MYTYRPCSRAPAAMVASAHPLATVAGLAVLRDGGNAIDAGLAVNAVLNVTQPPCCGFGGDAFFLYFEAATGRLWAYNASGRSPAAATPERIRAAGFDSMPTRGPLAITVPGAVEGWGRLHQRFGRRAWGGLFEPAICYASDGFPVSDHLANWIAGAAEVLATWPASAAAMMPAGRPPRPGERLRQPDLAAILERLAEHGPGALYRGPLAEAIATGVADAGGWLAADDLASHRGQWTEPVGIVVGEYQVLVHGPNSQGWTLPYMLGLLAQRFDLTAIAPASADAVHLGVEAKRLAFDDRDAYNTDPDHMSVAVTSLLDPSYLAERAEQLDPERAGPILSPGGRDGDTTYFAVVDQERNALSVIQSLYHGFGSGFVAPGTGLFLQNRGAYFSLDPAHPNVLAPRKRTAHTLCATMVLRNNRPAIVPGTMGGDAQPQILLQILSAMLYAGLNPQQAIELPRWVHAEGGVRLERRFEPAVADELERRGHRVEWLDDWAASCGHAQVIAVDEHGLSGGADPRGDGMAAGF